MRVLICGGRDFDNRTAIRNALISLCASEDGVDVVIEGAAPGADALAREAAEDFGITVETYPADWDKHGKAAGPIRNQQMLDEGKPDLVLAFPTPQSRGTWDMVRRARKAGIEARVF